MMPFRVPCEFRSLSLVDRDPSPAELESYILWLMTELKVAELQAESMRTAPARRNDATTPRDQ